MSDDITLEITDGSTTLSLNGSGAYDGVSYYPRSPSMAEAMNVDINVMSETATLNLRGTVAEIRDAMQAIERLFTHARRRQESRSGPKIYVRYKVSSGETLYRSELVDGHLELAGDAQRRQVSWGLVQAELTFVRRVFWEAASSANLGSGALTNNGSSRLVLGTVAGSLPAPIKLTITNTSGTISPRNFYAAINAFAEPGAVDFTLPGGSISWSTSEDHSTQHWEYDFDAVSPGQMADLGGERYYILVGLESATGNGYLRANVYTELSVVHDFKAHSDEVYVGTDEQIIKLGPLPLPPNGSSLAINDINLGLSVRDVSASPTGSFSIAWVQLAPSAPGSFRYFRQTGFTHNSGDKWIDDGVDDYIYTESSTGDLNEIMAKSGEPLQVWPGESNELRLVFDEQVTGVVDTRTVSASVDYRPRRLSL